MLNGCCLVAIILGVGLGADGGSCGFHLCAHKFVCRFGISPKAEAIWMRTQAAAISSRVDIQLLFLFRGQRNTSYERPRSLGFIATLPNNLSKRRERELAESLFRDFKNHIEYLDEPVQVRC